VFIGQLLIDGSSFCTISPSVYVHKNSYTRYSIILLHAFHFINFESYRFKMSSSKLSENSLMCSTVPDFLLTDSSANMWTGAVLCWHATNIQNSLNAHVH